jgi:hypothetical protein
VRLLRDALRARAVLRERDEVGVELDAVCLRPALGRGDHHAAVARAEVVDDVVRRDLRHRQHALDERLRRGHPDDVLAGLPLLGLGRVLGGGLLGRRQQAADDEEADGQVEGHAELRSLGVRLHYRAQRSPPLGFGDRGALRSS